MEHRFSTCLVLGLTAAFVFLSGCDGESDTSPPPVIVSKNALDDRPATMPSTGPAISPAEVKDESLPADEYVRLGFPAYDRQWAGQDMASVAVKLAELAIRNPRGLPKFGSLKSGEMFARMVNPENLAIFENKSLPLESRFPMMLQYTQALNAIAKTYLRVSLGDGRWTDETVELLGAQLHSTRTQVALVNELIPTIPKDDPNFAARMAGLNNMRQGLALQLSGVCAVWEENTIHSLPSRLRLLEHAQDCFPGIVPMLTEPAKMELLVRIGNVVNNPKTSDMRPQLLRLQGTLKPLLEPNK